MELDDQAHAAPDDESMMLSPEINQEDPRTYDPTQGLGTPGWQEAKRKQAELNMKLGLQANAAFRRN